MKASGYARNADDWYQEPRFIIDALLDREPLIGLTWDPACGGGNIPEAIKARGLVAIGTDIADRGYGRQMDFLREAPQFPASIENIVSNPPYGIIEPWIRRSIERTTGKVCILARLAFLEGQARRDGLFKEHPISRVWVSSRRVSMPPGGTDVKAKGGSIAYAFFVWDHSHTGPTTLGFL